MKRDADLIRLILLKIEELGAGDGATVTLEFEDYAPAVVIYHVKLLAEAKLIHALDLSSVNQSDWVPTDLTWAGHEFLDMARSSTLWEKAKAVALTVSGALGMVALQTSLETLIKTGLQDVLLKLH